MEIAPFLDQLGPERRLALAYANSATRLPLLGLMTLDARLAEQVRAAREPLPAQLRLAWWRDELAKPAGQTRGEPLLDLLEGWGAHRPALAVLCDGWEELLGEAPLSNGALARFAGARGAACAALAIAIGEPSAQEAAARAGQGWALAELAGRLGNPEERDTAQVLCAGHDWRRPVLPRALRPLLVLHGLAARGWRRGQLLGDPSGIIVAARLGLLGI